MSPRLGFVGIGFMGRGMAKNIANKFPAKYKQFTVYDSNPLNEHVLKMAKEKYDYPFVTATSAAHLASQSDIVMCSLPSEQIATDVLFGKDGLISGFTQANKHRSPILHDVPPGTPIIVDHGTFSRKFVVDCHEEAKRHGVMYIDAPVSGGPKGAADGTLTVMMGGPDLVCEAVRPVLHTYASKILHFGPVGSGMAAKLVNQALVAMHAQAACEALHLAEKVGLLSSDQDAERLLSMLTHSWGHSKVLELTLTDYISALKAASSDNNKSVSSSDSVSSSSSSNSVNNSISPADLLSNAAVGLRKSAAPLRNMAKDMDCVVGELTAEELGLAEGGAPRLPVLAASHAAIQRACSQEVGLKDAAFVCLLELINNRRGKE